MGISEYKELFMKFNRQECTGSELKKLWDWLADSTNESLIKEWLLKDLSDYHVNKSGKGVVDFSYIYKNIKSSLPVSDSKKK